MSDLAALHDTMLEYELGVTCEVETASEYRVKMYEKRDVTISKSIIPLLENLIHKANLYKEWLETISEDGNCSG